MLLQDLMTAIGRASRLDPVSKKVAGAVQNVTRPTPVKNALSGTWLGHPLHPLLTDIPIGSFTSAFILDLIGGRRGRSAADLLVEIGVVSTLPTAAAGLSDWSETIGAERRIGFVHAVANVVGLGCYALSMRARRQGHRFGGVSWSLLGAGALTAGGYLGGHLSYAQGVGVNRTAFEHRPTDWKPALPQAQVSDNAMHRVSVDGVDVMVVQQGGQIRALAATCNHEGGPLEEGELQDGCVVCPWHSSTFRLEDGSVIRGPASMPQPAYETRVVDGMVEVRATR